MRTIAARRATSIGRLIPRMTLILGVCTARTASSDGVPFIFDDNRIFARLDFVKPDGSVRRALAYVDIGTPEPVVTAALAADLQLGKAQPFVVRIDGERLTVDPSRVAIVPDGDLGHTGPDGRATIPVEAVVSGSLMKDYVVTIDYGARSLRVARSRLVLPDGVPVACDVNPVTGLISVRAEVAGRSYDAAIDFGSAYTWFRIDTVEQWTTAHPEWRRGRGAVGESNMQTRKPEASATIVRIPEVRVGDLYLRDVGALGMRPELPPFPPFPGGPRVSGDMFDWYSAKAPRPVIGWIGANVLKAYRIAIDYPHRTIWWSRERDPDRHDLDQVGVTLEDRDGYVVSGIAQHHGHPAVTGIEVGDRLVRIDNVVIKGATRGAMFSALHGAPGETKILTVERHGTMLTVPVKVTGF